ncbi:hypothetical protein EYF80_055509 [Liparis tanakae]|uniref:Uncharacterized protein n=1 Tax=Liparis tanakae TaxID=230148 RepID=A0A4Z2EZZ0_9TELE|nr:hypothetical protein EYF80_055509 [Liparis tanakae]
MFQSLKLGPMLSSAQPPYSYQPGRPFPVQPKAEAAASANQTWRIMESLNPGPPPKATPVAHFPMSQAAPPPCSATAAASQEYSTVNLADLQQQFYPDISTMVQGPPAPQGSSSCSSQSGVSFAPPGPQYHADAPLVDDDIPEFPSLNMEDFEDLLNPVLMSGSGSGASMSAQAPCQQSPAAFSTAVQNNSDPAGVPGSTWMNYPNSIVHLLQNEGMMDNGGHRPPVLDELDELMSADEDRLISIFNGGGQAGFVSGHPT